MYVRDANIGDVIRVAGGNKGVRQSTFRVPQEEREEAYRYGFMIGFVRHFWKGNPDKPYDMIYLGHVNTTIPVGGLFKHHLFLTPDGTYGIDGYDFRYLEKITGR